MTQNRRLLVWVWLIYLLFVVYGSLVPLDFHPRPLGEAWNAFRHIGYLHLAIGDRADWVANILLFIPLSFFWLGMLVRDRGPFYQAFLSLCVLASCAALSVAIEFTQLFFPPRTVSLNDIVAETIGAVIGIAAWFSVGPTFHTWLSFRRAIRERGRVAGAANLLLRIYLGLLFFYNLMPFDLTLSPVEIYHKWKAGRVVLVPFGFHFSDTAQMIYSMGTDILLWVPMPVLLMLVGQHRLRSWFLTVGSAALIEFLQLFVYTRISDVTQIMMAAVGAAVGVWIGSTAVVKRRGLETPTHSAASTMNFASKRLLLGLLGALAWTALLALVFWYPFNFRIERVFVLERIHRLTHSVPFQGYYFATEYRALTEVLHKTLFFAPLGVTLAMAASSLYAARWRFVAGFVAVAIIGAVALGIDLGRMLLPEKRPDIADWFLQVSGALLGYWMTFKFRTQTGDALPGSSS